MANISDPGIHFDSFYLLDCKVTDLEPDRELAFNPKLVGLSRKVGNEDENKLYITAYFDIFADLEEPPLSLKCAFVVIYTREENAQMTWEEFSTPLALAHIVPFLREFVSNITWRMPLPRLVMSPINTYALVKEYEQRHSTEEEDSNP